MTQACAPPGRIVAGDSFEFSLPVPSRLSDYTGALARITGPSTLDGTATVDSGSIAVSFGTGTDTLESGIHTLTVWMTATNKRQTVQQWTVNVATNLAEAEDGEGTTHAARMVAILETAIEARATGGMVEAYNIDGTNVAKAPIAELRKLLRVYQAEVAQAASGRIGSIVFAVPNSGALGPMGWRWR